MHGTRPHTQAIDDLVGDKHRSFGGVGWYIGLSIIAIIMMLPFVAMVVMSFRPEHITSLREIFTSPEVTLEHYRYTLSSNQILRWIFNSLVYALVSLVIVLLLCTAAGYAFAKKQFFGRDVLFWLMVAVLMIPSQVMLVPLFTLIVDLGWANTYQGLIAPTLANATGVFLLRQYIRGIPDELLEAAVLDGASEFRTFWEIIIPLTMPVQATLSIFVFLWHWNDFIWPLIITQSETMWTLTVGLATLENYVPSTNSLMAAATISFLPTLIVFILCQRYIVQSIVTTGIKG